MSRDMPGWDSLETVTRLHGAAQVAGLILLALLGVLAIAMAYQLRGGVRRPWLDIGAYQISSKLFETACVSALVLLAVAEITAYVYGTRQQTLTAAASHVDAERLNSLTAELQSRPAQEPTSYLKENSELRQKLAEAENRFTALETSSQQLEQTRKERDQAKEGLDQAKKDLDQTRAGLEQTKSDLERARSDSEQAKDESERIKSDLQQARGELRKIESAKHLSQEERQTLVDALKPFAGQKIAVAFIRDDDGSRALAQDVVAALDAAGWDHNGSVTARQWDRDPIGIEVALNEQDARAGRIATGVGALINTLRRLRLTDDDTIYMDSTVPSGQVLLKVGRKLKR
jgi:hypothetical protein